MAAPSGNDNGGSSISGGQGLPPSWMFWAQQQDAGHFPAAAIAATGGGSQQQQPVAGACDLTTLRRSLVQQLHEACPSAFHSAAAASTSGDADRQQQQELQAASQRILARLQASGSGARKFVPWVGSLLQGITGAAAVDAEPGKPACQAWLFQQRRFLHRVRLAACHGLGVLPSAAPPFTLGSGSVAASP
jgi:hypothetical protein